MHLTRIVAAALALAAGSALPLHAQDPISVGQTVRGTLTPSSPKMSDGSHYHLHRVTGRAGQTITITLRSDDFDAYLSVGGMVAGDLYVTNYDDDSAGGTDARVVVTFLHGGEDDDYVIRANTVSGGETGAYTLAITEGGEHDGQGIPPVDFSGEGVAPGFAGDLVALMLESTALALEEAQNVTLQGPPVRGFLTPGEMREMDVRVKAAGLVLLMGACDQSCTDMDMTVYGPDGSVVGSDILPDPAPMVRLKDVPAGLYRVRLHMALCESSRCAFGMQVLGRP